MSHIGQTIRQIPLWRERWIDSALGRGGRMESYRAGTQSQTLERYQCENCGHFAEVIGKATEPFYCSSQLDAEHYCQRCTRDSIFPIVADSMVRSEQPILPQTS